MTASLVALNLDLHALAKLIPLIKVSKPRQETCSCNYNNNNQLTDWSGLCHVQLPE